VKTLVFIVNGEETPVQIPDSLSLRTAVEWALDDANVINGDRPFSAWEVRHNSGQLVGNGDISLPVSEYGLAHRAWLFITLAIGAGGNAWMGVA
jgi:hypothetical protein